MQRVKKLTILIFSLIFTFTLIFFKYHFNGLGFNEFSIFKLGNLIDLFPLALIFTGLVIKRNYKFDSKETDLLLLGIVLGILFLALSILIKKSTTFEKFYILTYSYNRILELLFLLFAYSANLIVGFYLTLKNADIIKSFKYTLYFGLILLLLALSMNLDLQFKIKSAHPKSKYDVGVILGAAVWHKNRPSPILRARVNKGIELYKNGNIHLIQVTGSNAPGEASEALVAKKLLLAAGIPSRSILFENKTRSTSEQIRFIKKHFGKGKKIAVISDGFHLSRILQICSFFNIKVNGISSEYKLNWRKSIYYALREGVGLILFWAFAV